MGAMDGCVLLYSWLRKDTAEKKSAGFWDTIESQRMFIVRVSFLFCLRRKGGAFSCIFCCSRFACIGAAPLPRERVRVTDDFVGEGGGFSASRELFVWRLGADASR